MRRNIIIIICILALIFAAGLCGFTLAQPDASENAQNDRMIGVLITTEYLDLFDVEGYLSDNIGKMSGGDITISDDNSKYQDRLYATLKDKRLTSEYSGEVVTTKEYVFEGVRGFPYFYYTITDGTETYNTASGNEAVSDGHTDISVTDEGESVTLDGTIYVASTGGNVTYYMNPVYQSSDGRVYAMSGSGMSFDGDSEGMTCSHTIDSSTTVTENGEKKTHSISVKTTISVMNPPRRVSVLQFDSDDAILSREEYLPGSLPETITPKQGCSYIILETIKTSPNQGETVSRTLYQMEDETLENFYLRDDGVCVKQSTALKWTL